MKISNWNGNTPPRKLATILFIAAGLCLLILWFGLKFSALFFGREVTGQVLDVTTNTVQTAQEHRFVHTHVTFKTIEGQEIEADYLGDTQMFKPGPIKVRYKPSDPSVYIFTEPDSSYIKFYSLDQDGTLMTLLVSASLAILLFLAGLKTLGFDILKPLTNLLRR